MNEPIEFAGRQIEVMNDFNLPNLASTAPTQQFPG